MTVIRVNRISLASAVAALFLVLLISPKARGEIIPSGLRIDWGQHAGVPGGIPHRTVIYATLNPGATAAQINTAIANCPNNQVVFLNAGTYNVGEINLRSVRGVTLRGAGPGRTIINSSATGACIDSDQYGFSSGVGIVSGYTKGSTNIVLSSASGFTVGNLIRLDQNDDTSFVFTSQGPGRNVAFTARITAISGNNVTFSPPLPWGFSSSLAPRAGYQVGGPGLSWTGIEDMTINNNGGATDMFYLWGAYACWAKNIEMTKGENTFSFFVQSLQCEVRHCYVHHAVNAPLNTDGFGVYLYDGSSYCLVEDNIFSTLFVSFWQSRASGNAFLYNFCTNGVAQGFAHQLGIMNAGHGAHCMMSLWEGNIGEQWQHDGYHGSASHQILFRNWIHGLSTYNDNRKMIDITRGSYFYSVVGNVLGHGSWTANQFEMSGQPGYDNGNVIYRLGYPNVANNSYSQAAPWPSSYGLTYPDARSKATLLRHGNYDYHSRSILWDSSISDRTIPNSLYHNSKPSYFGNLPWPPFDPASPNSASMTNIPAGYRFAFGVDPPSGPVNHAPTAIANASPTLGLAPLAVSFSSAGSSDSDGTALTYVWNFGDGTPNSTAANPSHTYQNNGSYFARLTVSDGTNTVTSSDINIRVGNQPPVVAASATPRSGPAPLVVAFSSAGSSDPEGVTLTYSWNFGDASSVSTAANPSHTYQANGIYTARLTVSDGNSSISSNLVITVNNGLVAAYDFDAGTGATLNDASGNGNIGVIGAATWATSGRFGRALSFNGTTSVITVNDSASLDLSDGLTLEAWVYPASYNADYQSIISKPMNSSFTAISYVLHGGSRPNSVPSFAVSGSSQNLLGPGVLPLNVWSHLAATYDGATMRLYVNGAQVASQAQTGDITTSDEPLSIGLGWAGLIDELRIYNRALSSTQIQSDMNSAVGGGTRPAAPSGLRVVQQ